MVADSNENNEPTVPRDFRAVIVAVVGLAVILIGGLVAIIALPGPISKNQIDNASQNTVAIASAGFTAVAAVVSAYFGIKAANLAREDSSKAAEQNAKAAERNTIRATHLAGAQPGQAAEAEKTAADSIKDLKLV